MSVHFYSVPAWAVGKPPSSEQLRPEQLGDGLLAEALTGIEYRGAKAWDRAQELSAQPTPAIYARAPADLPALLRTADQLTTRARMDAGERAHVWKCECGARYAVAVSLVRPVSLNCQSCGRVVDLDPDSRHGVESITDEQQAVVNGARLALAAFFREAMARGWPVLVAQH